MEMAKSLEWQSRASAMGLIPVLFSWRGVGGGGGVQPISGGLGVGVGGVGLASLAGSLLTPPPPSPSPE